LTFARMVLSVPEARFLKSMTCAITELDYRLLCGIIEKGGFVAEVQSMKRILFVCVENSGRSQMAEAFAKAYGTGKIEAASAGFDLHFFWG